MFAVVSLYKHWTGKDSDDPLGRSEPKVAQVWGPFPTRESAEQFVFGCGFPDPEMVFVKRVVEVGGLDAQTSGN